MGWVTPELRAILLEHGTQFFAAKKTDRDDIVDEVEEKLKAAKPDLVSDRLSSQIKTWYNNEIARFRQPEENKLSPTKVKMKQYNSKSVAKERHEERYQEIKEDLSKGGTEWNDLYRTTMKKLWDELDDEEQNKCSQISKERNTGNIGEAEKRSLAAVHADKKIASFTKKMYDMYGARIVCLASWIDDRSHAQSSVHETSVAPKFSQQFPKWKTQKGVASAFVEYGQSFEDGDLSSDEDNASVKKAKYPWAQIDFYCDDDDVDQALRNYPILPEIPLAKRAQEWIGGAKIVIRAFVKAVHELQVGSSIVPWGAMASAEGAHALIPSQCLPSGLALRDPSRMVKSEVEAYFKHWHSRQKDGKKPLNFRVQEAKEKREEDKAARVAALKSKKRGYVEVSEGEDGGDSVPMKKPKAAPRRNAPSSDEEDSGVEDLVPKNSKLPPKKIAPAMHKAKQENPKRPIARPILNASTRKEILVALSAFPPYRSLVDKVLKAATAVVDWMSNDPHIPPANTTFHYTEASNILLIVGLTLRECKACSEAEPDTPLHAVPFDYKDLEIVQATLIRMDAAIQPKRVTKWGVSASIYRAIDSTWRKVCLEVGLGEDDIKAFDSTWKAFAEGYAAADSALTRSGKAPALSAIDVFPDSIRTWATSGKETAEYPPGDPTDWNAEMTEVWKLIKCEITAAKRAKTTDNLLNRDWCRRGRGGLVCLVLGMKWWRTSLMLSPSEASMQIWLSTIVDMTAAFALVSSADSV
ncbi:hypothetical protein K438DRAFT_2086115 [Mycena galopus ATCC 62051]|nr:hypothetical protein K438DRAFT_2086115 [Mycena galopus ATCC 62051]